MGRLTNHFWTPKRKSTLARRLPSLERLEQRQVFAGFGVDAIADPDDQISEAVQLGDLSTERYAFAAIDDGYDVDMYSFTAAAGETVEIDVVPLAGSNLSTRVRLFGEFLGRENQPLGGGIGSIRFQISKSGTFFVGVSELGNEFYNPLTGNSDLNDPTPTTGEYQLSIKREGSELTPKSVPDEHGSAQVLVSLVAINEDGEEISTIDAGEEFSIEVRVRDLREHPQGVFSAYVDLTFNAELVSAGEILHSDSFIYGRSGGVVTLGEVDEVGGVNDPSKLDGLGGSQSSSEPSAGSEQVVFSVRFQSHEAGTALFSLNAADLKPAHDMLLYGTDDPIDVNQITFGSLPLEIAPLSRCLPDHNCILGEDVNGDGLVTPHDALIVINDLNNTGPRELVGQGHAYIDVTADGSVTSLDVLRVVNYLNRRAGVGSTGTGGDQSPPTPNGAANQPATTPPGSAPTVAANPHPRLPRSSTPANGPCANSPVAIALGKTCSSSTGSSNSNSPTRISRGLAHTASSRVGDLFGHASTANAIYTSTVDRALTEFLAEAM